MFDNADHRAGGQWNQFAEIAVKRVLTRDGTSSYYINNQPVRRRDVQDVFLGTGLGPRPTPSSARARSAASSNPSPRNCACSSRKPPASKYKERRRETENRLNDTRETSPAWKTSCAN